MNSTTKISTLPYIRLVLFVASVLGAILSLVASKIIVDSNSTTTIAKVSVPILWVISLCFFAVAGYAIYIGETKS